MIGYVKFYKRFKGRKWGRILEKLGKNAKKLENFMAFFGLYNIWEFIFKNFGFMEFTGSIFWIDAERATKPY